MSRSVLSGKPRLCVLFALVIALSPVASPASAQSLESWPTRAGSVSRTAFVADDLSLDNGQLNLRWTRFLGERIEVEMEPVVVGDLLYIGVMNGKMYALQRDTGATVWVYNTGMALTDTPSVAQVNSRLMIFFGSTNGNVYGLDALTGEPLWVFPTGAPVMSTPSVHRDVVYIGNLDGVFYALEAATGAVRWFYATGAPIANTSAVGEAVFDGAAGIFVANGSNVAFAFREDGSLAWQAQMWGVFTKHTYAVYANGVVMFVTRKPGAEYSEPKEDVPDALQGARRSGPEVLDIWADFYIDYPKRRTLYFFDAETGADLWQPEQDKTRHSPLYIPYWGLITPVVDDQGYAWLPATGGGGDGALDHDIRLFRLDLRTGEYVQVAEQDPFLLRFDEVGRPTLVGSRYYQTISEDVGYYDIATGEANANVFSNNFNNHRMPYEFDAWASGQEVFGGMHKHFTRFGGSTPGGYGGAVDAVSPLIVVGDEAYFVTWGHVYALTNQPVTPAADYGALDLTPPPTTTLSREEARAMLNEQVQAIVAEGQHIEPASRMWSWADSVSFGLLWHHGTVVHTLARTLPYLEAPVSQALQAYLKREVETYLLDAYYYEYRQACLNYGAGTVLDPCEQWGIQVSWYWTNPNLIAERLYALYEYAASTGDWGILEDNWNFILTQYRELKEYWDPEVQFFLVPGWLAGAFSASQQIGAMLAVREMAAALGDAATQEEAGNYLNQMLEGHVRLATFVRGLYDTGQLQRLEISDPEMWGFAQPISPIPVEGYLDRTNDYRQPFLLERNEAGELQIRFADSRYVVYPYTLIGYHPIYPELSAHIRTNLLDPLSGYLAAIERLWPWWYMNDYGHGAITSGHEDDSLSPLLASDIFQARAYIFGEPFEALAPYLPWPLENFQHRDILRVQNLVALLQAPSMRQVVTTVNINAQSGAGLNVNIRAGAGLSHGIVGIADQNAVVIAETFDADQIERSTSYAADDLLAGQGQGVSVLRYGDVRVIKVAQAGGPARFFVYDEENALFVELKEAEEDAEGFVWIGVLLPGGSSGKVRADVTRGFTFTYTTLELAGGSDISGNALLSDGRPVAAPVSFDDVTPNTNTVDLYGKFEISFLVDRAYPNPYMPYDAEAAPQGVTVDGVFSPDNWQTVIVQPAFYYEEYERVGSGNWTTALYPTGESMWKVRFAPTKAGAWQYRLRLTDASGTYYYPQQGVLLFEAIPSDNPGFLNVSERDNRFFTFTNGETFLPFGFGSGYDTFEALENELAQIGAGGASFFRWWLSGMNIVGSAWTPWQMQDIPYDGYIPPHGLTGEEAWADSLFSVKLDTQDLHCLYQVVPVKPNTDYVLSARVKLVDVGNPINVNLPHGFMFREAGWAEPKSCIQPGHGRALSANPTIVNGTHDWMIVLERFNSGQHDTISLKLNLQNVREGAVYIDSVSLREDLGDGELGPEVFTRPDFDYQSYFSQRPSWFLDYALEAAEELGLYYKFVILEKNDWVYRHIDRDGGPRRESGGMAAFHSEPGAHVRRLHEAYLRYLTARWGYSTSVHSWEIVNEAPPGDVEHFAFVNDLAAYIKQVDPNQRLVTTSTWCCGIGDGYDLWNDPRLPDIGYGDFHAYTGEADHSDWLPFSPETYYDLANWFKAHADTIRDQDYRFPIVAGEIGVGGFGGEDEALRRDTEGVWLHNLTWAWLYEPRLSTLYWYGENIRQHGLFDVFRPIQAFLDGVPLASGFFVAAEAEVSNANLRAWGQKDTQHNGLVLWVQNRAHTWKSVVDGADIAPESGLVTVAGFAPNLSLEIETWNTYTGQLLSVTPTTTDGDGNLVLRIDALRTDLAYRIMPNLP